MRTLYRHFGTVIGVLFIFFIYDCATSGYNKGQFNIISISEESGVGRDIDKEVGREFRKGGMTFEDSRVIAYIENLGQKLVAHAPEKNFDYHFRLVKTPEVNAFALPAGYIYVNAGLIAEADNEAELAGVLSHEIGHVVARHWAERYSAVIIGAIAAQILIETQEDETNRLLTELAIEIAATGGLLAYSRANEREADELGLQILYKAGYRPKAMADFFEKMHDRTGDMSKIQVFLSTHPDPRDRESRMHEAIESLPRNKNLIWNTNEFKNVKNIVSQIKYPEKKKKKARK